MTNDFDKLFERARRDLIGFDPLFSLLLDDKRYKTVGVDGYPPYNIEKLDDEHWLITVALAGFTSNDIDITVEDRKLTLTSKQQTEAEATRNYLHKGIAKRSFERRFILADDVEVKRACLQDGLLSIELERIIPESKKPRKIEIAS
ncbi:MAG: Hsp20 family protein [Richelia sp. RM2_1_2]|nr:Hsp20 family protein [Richelia sp. RM2_1_2]